MASLDDIVGQASRLKPTATVVRKESGNVKVEREYLMSGPQKIEAIFASKRAGEARGEREMMRLQQDSENVCNEYIPRTYALNEMASAKKELDEKGVVVFRDVIDEGVQQRYIDDMWSWLHRRSGGKVRRNDPTTWGNDTWPDRFAGIYSGNGICHLPIAWEVREMAAPYFEGIYCDADLLVSFDGANIMRPTSGTDGSKDYLTKQHWLHVDSDGSAPPSSSGYQGLVSVSGMDGTDHKGGCFQAVVRSHREDFEMFRREGAMTLGSGYTFVPRMHRLRRRMPRVIAPDRSLVIWKNELFHCNSPNLSGRFRFAQYVNYCPGRVVGSEARRERSDAFERGIGSSHRVDVFRPSSGPCQDFYAPNLTKRQMELLGKSV